MSNKGAPYPKARRFAVVRMDPVAMVEHLRDPLATNAARAMRTRKYLVYLEFPQDLPMPDSEYCRYRVNAVATRLRPPVPEKGITNDMVIPIYPNKRHARDDTKISSTPPFPFSNCYFWIDSRMSLRVRKDRERGCDDGRAYRLDISQHLALSDAFEHDFTRINCFWRERRTVYAEELVFGADPPSVRPSLDTSFLATSAFYEDHSALEDDFDWSPNLSPSRSPSPSTPLIPPSITDLLSMNLFGWDEDPSFLFIPLVDLWLELDEHFIEEHIPNPVGLWKEQEKIGRIIKDSLERRERGQLPLSLFTLSHAEHSPPTHAPRVPDERAPKPRRRGNDGFCQPQELALAKTTATREASAPRSPPPSTLTYDHRSWSGDIHYEDPVPLPTPRLEKSSEADLGKHDSVPQAVVVKARSADTLEPEPVPAYRPLDTLATSMTPPPSYASLFKNAGAPAPRPTQGSRAAVWPSRHLSPVFQPALAPKPRFPHSAADASLRSLERRAIEEARRLQQRQRTGGYPSDRDSHFSQRASGSSLPSTSHSLSWHAFSFSYVQETVVHRSSSRRDLWMGLEEDWLPVKERVVPSRRSDAKGHATSSRGDFFQGSSRALQAELSQFERMMVQAETQLQRERQQDEMRFLRAARQMETQLRVERGQKQAQLQVGASTSRSTVPHIDTPKGTASRGRGVSRASSSSGNVARGKGRSRPW